MLKVDFGTGPYGISPKYVKFLESGEYKIEIIF